MIQFFVEKKLILAGGAIAADFGAGNGDADAAILGNLLFQFFIEAAFKFADTSAAQAGHMDMIARAVAFIKMAVAAQMEQIKLVNQTVAFEEVNGAIDSDASDSRMHPPRPAQQAASIQMAPRGFHHLQQHPALVGQANSPRSQLLLQASAAALDINALTCRDAMFGIG